VMFLCKWMVGIWKIQLNVFWKQFSQVF